MRCDARRTALDKGRMDRWTDRDDVMNGSSKAIEGVSLSVFCFLFSSAVVECRMAMLVSSASCPAGGRNGLEETRGVEK